MQVEIASDVPIPAFSPSPTGAAAAEADWFAPTSLAGGCATAPRVSSITPSTTRFLIVFDPNVPGALERIEKMGPVSHRYMLLPIVELETDADSAASLEGQAGIRAALPALGGLAGSRTVASGFDLIFGLATTQNNQRTVQRYGGRLPGDPDGYPILVEDDSGWRIGDDPDADWPATAALIPVVSLSVGPRSASHPFLMNDLVNIATLLASYEMVVVVAAGNCGELGEGTMSAWAQAPWVLAVGATADEEGTTLASFSSRGRADDPDSGPDVVTYGTSVLKPYPSGTSFAAPRVAHLVRLVAAALVQLGREVELAEGAEPRGVPVVGLGMIDDFGDEFDSLPFKLHWVPALPIIGVDAASVREAVAAANDVGVRVDVNVKPAFLRAFLIDCATEMPGYAPHEVGHGFLDAARVVKRLAAITFRDVIGWFSSDPVDTTVGDRFAQYRVFVPEDVELLDMVLRSTGPHVRYDFKTQDLEIFPEVKG